MMCSAAETSILKLLLQRERLEQHCRAKGTDRDAKNIVNGDCSQKFVFLNQNVLHFCEVVGAECESRLSAARAVDELAVLQNFTMKAVYF